MDILALFASYGGWAWIVAGLVLLGIELVAPGGVFVWLGAAAIVTGIAALVQPIAVPVQWVLFGILGIVSVAAWLNYSRRQPAPESDQPLLNRRAARLVGQTASLSEPITQGFGRIDLGDSVWRVRGPDLAAGTKVHIIGFEGAVLLVEPVGGRSDPSGLAGPDEGNPSL